MPTIRCDMCGRETDEGTARQIDVNAIHWACDKCLPEGVQLISCKRCNRPVTLPAEAWDDFLQGPLCDDCAEEDE